MKTILTLLLTAFSLTPLLAQHAVDIHWQFPLKVGFGYQYQFSNKLGAKAEIGLLSEPNTSAILSVLEQLGTDGSITNMIENAFQNGVVGKIGVHYFLHPKHAVGIGLTGYSLIGKETPYNLVEAVMDEDLSSFPTRGRNPRTNENTLTLRSMLWQAGIYYEYFIPLSEKWALKTGLEASVNIGSASSIESEVRDFSRLSGEVDTYLEDIYSQYGYLSGISLGIVFYPGK
jgi:hypothetical protein